jgi:FAD/FMN-containing dehydrogenase
MVHHLLTPSDTNLTYFRYVDSADRADTTRNLGSIMISTARYNKIINLDTQNNTITVQAGTKLDAVLDHLKSKGFTLPTMCNGTGFTVGEYDF